MELDRSKVNILGLEIVWESVLSPGLVLGTGTAGSTTNGARSLTGGASGSDSGAGYGWAGGRMRVSDARAKGLVLHALKRRMSARRKRRIEAD